jgi:hypothetical protein
MEFENDLLDLCRLNLMEEYVAESSSVDKDATMKAIDWKKRNLMERLKNAPEEN